MSESSVGSSEEFWNSASQLLSDVSVLSRELESSEVSDQIRLAVRRLASQIPETPEPLGEMDPYLRDALLTAVIHAFRSEEAGDRAQLRIAIERIRQALRDVLDERPVWRGGPKDAVLWLRDLGLSTADMTQLFAVSDSTVRRWLAVSEESVPGGEQGDRIMVVAKVVNHLRHAMTPRGIVNWLQRPHPALDDRTPMDELKDADSYRRLVDLAAGARSFAAT